MRLLSRSRNALVLVAALFALWGQAPAPVTGVHVNAKRVSSSWPDATNTGYAWTGVTLTAYAGPSTITTNGTVIDSKEITSCLTIQALNVTIKRSWLHASCSYLINNDTSSGGKQGLIVEDSLLECPATEAGHTGIADSAYISRRNRFKWCENGMWAENHNPTDEILIEENWVERILSDSVPGLAHPDGIQLPDDVHHVTIRHNRIDNTSNGTTSNPSNSAITIGHRVASTVLITTNLMAGGGFTLYCRAVGEPAGPAQFTLNHFSTIFVATVGVVGPLGDCSGEPNFTGNVCHETNAAMTTATTTCAPAPSPEAWLQRFVPLWHTLPQLDYASRSYRAAGGRHDETAFRGGGGDRGHVRRRDVSRAAHRSGDAGDGAGWR